MKSKHTHTILASKTFFFILIDFFVELTVLLCFPSPNACVSMEVLFNENARKFINLNENCKDKETYCIIY